METGFLSESMNRKKKNYFVKLKYKLTQKLVKLCSKIGQPQFLNGMTDLIFLMLTSSLLRSLS